MVMVKSKKLNDELDVVYNPDSTVKLKCIKEHEVKFPDANGKMTKHTYKVGDIFERRDIFLKPTCWCLA